jgi:hypothetical protein
MRNSNRTSDMRVIRSSAAPRLRQGPTGHALHPIESHDFSRRPTRGALMFAHDLKFALRTLLRHRSFTAVAVLTLAVALGAKHRDLQCRRGHPPSTPSVPGR